MELSVRDRKEVVKVGIREAAQAAVNAENAAKNAEMEALKVKAMQYAVREVKNRLGLEGKAVRLPHLTLDRNYKDDEIGNHVVVKVTDEDTTLFIQVKRYIQHKNYDQWTRRYASETPMVDFSLVNAEGHRPKHPVAKQVTLKGLERDVEFATEDFADLAGLGRELERYDAWLADEKGEVGRRLDDWKKVRR